MSKARILIVEDEVIIALQLEEKLKSLSYEVTSVVNNGNDVIKKAEQDQPDLILMDIRIQGDKDGIETAEIIKERFGIPVIFSTAYLDQERIERAKITMPFGYVLKPIQDRDLKVTLEMALFVAKADLKRRKAELEVVSQIDFLDSIMEQSPFAMWISDTTGTVIKTNRALRELLNLTDQQIIGLYNVLEDVNLEVQGVLSQVQSVFAHQKTAKFNIPWFSANAGRDEFKNARDLWIDVTIFPIVDKKGTLLNVVCQWIDITERKQIEELSQESEEKHRSLFETMTQGVVYQNAEGIIIDANPAAEQILGLSLSQLQGKTSMDPRWRAIHEDGSDFPGEDHPISVALKTGKIVKHIIQGVFHPDNEEYRWIRINAVPKFKKGESKPYEAYAIFDDITNERKKKK